MTSLPQALARAVGTTNVYPAGHAVADWLDGRNPHTTATAAYYATMIRKALRQSNQPGPDDRPDASLRAELKAELASQQEVVSSLRERVERLERRWARESAGGDKLDRQADGPAVPDGREPASVVGELIKRLRIRVASLSEVGANLSQQGDAIYFTRAADLLEQRHPEPVPVSERLPAPNVKVLAHYFNGLGKGRTICAIWVPAKSRSDDVGDGDDFMEYDEEDDKFYWPEGWYEQIENWEDLGWVEVHEGEVVYWQPLPEWPAMPLPAGEGETQP